MSKYLEIARDVMSRLAANRPDTTTPFHEINEKSDPTIADAAREAGEPKLDPSPAPLASPLIVIADAIAAAPRSPIETDLAYGRVAERYVEAQRAIAALPPVSQPEAVRISRDAFDQVASAIRRRDYLHGFNMLDKLVAKLRMMQVN
jgi:hypothetical protein